MVADITWATPAPITTTGNRTCAYCRSLYKTALDYDGPPLCEGCRGDTKATLGRIRRDIDSLLAQMNAALATFDAVCARHPAEWSKLEQALEMRADGRMTEAQLRERWAARMQDPNPAWPELLRAYEQRAVDLAPLAAERRRLEEAERVLA